LLERQANEIIYNPLAAEQTTAKLQLLSDSDSDSDTDSDSGFGSG